MNSIPKHLAAHRIILLKAEAQIRKNYQRISTQTKVAVENWLDKKTSPYSDPKK